MRLLWADCRPRSQEAEAEMYSPAKGLKSKGALVVQPRLEVWGETCEVRVDKDELRGSPTPTIRPCCVNFDLEQRLKRNLSPCGALKQCEVVLQGVIPAWTVRRQRRQLFTDRRRGIGDRC